MGKRLEYVAKPEWDGDYTAVLTGLLMRPCDEAGFPLERSSVEDWRNIRQVLANINRATGIYDTGHERLLLESATYTYANTKKPAFKTFALPWKEFKVRLEQSKEQEIEIQERYNIR